MATIKRPKTLCGLYGNRAKVVSIDGNRLTYRWPCGHERTEVLMQGPRGLRKPASDETAAFFAKYWAQGVTYECPRCRRKALAAAKKPNKP
jgi:hypothetical protein